MSKTKKSVALDDEVIAALEKRAKKEGRSFSNVVNEASKQYIKTK